KTFPIVSRKITASRISHSVFLYIRGFLLSSSAARQRNSSSTASGEGQKRIGAVCLFSFRSTPTMRSTMLIKLGLLLCFLSVNLIPSQSAVSSIDLGSEWMKVAVVNLKPGQSPIAIAINEMSKRKSPALVSFHSGSRLLAEEAAGITARYPNKVFSQLRDLIGKSYKDAKAVLDSMYLPFDAVEDSRGSVAFKVDDGQVYSVEELLAMILGYASNLAEVHAKLPVKDAVISVPPYFGQAERRGLIQAAQLAGINVLTLMNEHSGAALQYGIDKDFSNGSRYVIFYDMGSSSTYAALVYYSAYNTKEFGKTVSVNQFQVKDVRWDSGLGGQSMEMRLVEYFADEFNKQVGNGVDVRKSPKSMAKLKKQVKRTKEILSANTAAPISVESLYDDRDFRSTITREKFEELCGDLWDRSLFPIKEVIKHSGLKVDEISAVELIGGATRVPKLQAKIQEFLGRNELDKHLDADEAIVLGAALHAANLSDGIKLNRKLGMIDGSLYGLDVVLNGPDMKDEYSRQPLVPRMKKVPSKMFRSIIHNKDFEVSLEYETGELLPPSISSPVFAQYSVSGLAEASEKYSSRNLSSPVKASLHFSISRSGILSLDRADAVVEISEWVEVPVTKKNLTTETITNSSSNTTTSSTAESSSEESDEHLNSGGATGNESNPDVKEPSTTEVATEKKLKKRTFRVPLTITEKTAGPGKPLSEESLAEAKRKLEELNKKDSERRRTAESKNNLEGYIYSTKEKLETDEEFEKISSSEERQSFVEKLDEVQDWLYMDGEDATASEFEKRMDSLKVIGDPIFFRQKELTERPAATQLARKYLSELKQIVEGWEANKPWIPKDKITEVLSDAEKLKSWLDEKEAEQKQTSGSSKPAFTSEEVYTKVFKLQDKVTSINRIPKPKPKVEKPKKNETEEPKKSESEEGKKSDSEKSSESSEKTSGGSDDGSGSEKDGGAHDEL
ncbi:Heat shock 70 kDa protein 17, partial [Linum perenne]